MRSASRPFQSWRLKLPPFRLALVDLQIGCLKSRTDEWTMTVVRPSQKSKISKTNSSIEGELVV